MLLRNRYRILKQLGQGGFGKTFLAEDLDKLNEACVVKQFSPAAEIQANPELLQKAIALFTQEAKRLQTLGEHPQVPGLLASFEEGGQLYLVQQFIQGQTLAEHFKAEGRYNASEIRSLLLGILPILDFIHQHQVIHRDIKPENIIFSKTGKFVLVDFGAAKYQFVNAAPKTSMLIGTAAYAAPEQLAGKATFASDLYSLGVTCIHLLTGMEPFDLFDVQENDWDWQTYLEEPIDAKLAAILDRMLILATKRRYQSAAEVLTDLERDRPSSTSGIVFQHPSEQQIDRSPSPIYNKANLPLQCKHNLTHHKSWVTAIIFSSDSNIFASASLDGTIGIWNVNTGELLYRLVDEKSGSVTAIAISSDRITLAASYEDQRIRFWNIATSRLLNVSKRFYETQLKSLVFLENDRLVGVGIGGQLWTMKSSSNYPKLTSRLRIQNITSATINPRTNLVLAGTQSGQFLSQPANLEKLNIGCLIILIIISPFIIFTSLIGFILMFPYSLILLIPVFLMILIFPSIQSSKKVLGFHHDRVNCIAYQPMSSYLVASGSTDKTILLWNFSKKQKRYQLTGHDGSVEALAFSPDGTILASGSVDQTIRLWDLSQETVRCVAVLTGHTGTVNALAFSPDGQCLVSGSSDHTIKVWSITEEVTNQLSGEEQPMPWQPFKNQQLADQDEPRSPENPR
jgi:WD40 repeat protein